MYKSVSSDIKKYPLDKKLYGLHKEGVEKTGFGMDNSNELIDNGFGLYSTANIRTRIGPVKTEYYRIGLVRSGSAAFTIGLETFYPKRNNIIFGFPGQLFSLQDPTDDFFAYYLLFSDSFIAETLLLKNNRNQFPFLTYAGTQCFQLSEEEGTEVQNFIMQINDEIKARRANLSHAIKLYIQLIFVSAGRSYDHKTISRSDITDSSTNLFTRFLKLVSEHFLSVRKVAGYAGLLHVSADHLNRTIKQHSDRTAHELIDEMILGEAKAYLLHSSLSVAEIAYKLEFADPSHFNKFFKKLSACTPMEFRNKSE